MNVQKNLAIRFIRTKLNGLSIISKRKAGEEAFRVFCTPLRKTFDAAEVERAHKLKTRGEQLEFEFNGKMIRGFRHNHPAANKVLLLHGFSSNCHNLDHYVNPLVDKGFEVLAFDAPAHGKSDGKTVNTLDYSGMIKKVVELYGPIKNFIAHSFGGLSVSLALESLPHDATTKVALMAPATETTTAIETAFRLVGLKNKKIKKSLYEIIMETSGKKASWFSIRRAMHHISASILWIHDTDDDITPLADAMKVKEDGHSNIVFHITSGLGHRKIYHDSKVKNMITNFI